jgi:hypothetical protein
MDEDKVLKKLQKYNWFKSSDLKCIINSERMTYVLLKKWIRDNKLVRLPFYLYSPIDSQTGKYKADVFEVACQVNSQAYLCAVTAARIHGLDVADSQDIYIASFQRFNTIVFDGWTLRYKRAIETDDIVKKGSLRYSSYVLTVIEICKDYQKYMDREAFDRFLLSVDELKSQDVVRVLRVFNSKALNKRINHLIDSGLLNCKYLRF